MNAEIGRIKVLTRLFQVCFHTLCIVQYCENAAAAFVLLMLGVDKVPNTNNFPCLPNEAPISRANTVTHIQIHIHTGSPIYSLCVLWCSILIFLCILKPQSALNSQFSHQQLLSWMQLRQGSRDKLHIKTAPDEI